MELKQCSRCHVLKPKSNFNRDGRIADGLSTSCTDCAFKHKQESKQIFIEKNRERLRRYNTEYVRKRRAELKPAEKEARKKAVRKQLLTNKDLIADFKNLANNLGHTPSYDEYRRYGNYGHNTPSKRFGSWQAFVEAAFQIET